MSKELSTLKAPKGSHKLPKRVGRGEGSGHGKTAGRGSKGQGSRSGSGRKWGFEGGQMPLQRRLPKRGFTNIFKREYSVVALRDVVARFPAGARVDAEALVRAGLARRGMVKVVGSAQVDRPLVLRINAVSRGAREKVEAAGGSVEVV